MGPSSDELFDEWTFPEGWTKRATDHSMHTELVDPQGRRRASIFYKAAWYDRKADFHGFIPRYTVRTLYPADHNDPMLTEAVQDEATGETLWSQSFRRTRYPEPDPGDALREQARAWLTERYPDWQNPLSYWD